MVTVDLMVPGTPAVLEVGTRYGEQFVKRVSVRHNVSHAVVGQMFSVSADITPIKP